MNTDKLNSLALIHLVTALAFLLIAMALGVVGRLAISDASLLSPTVFYQIITAHPLVMVTGWGTMLLVGVMVYISPIIASRPLHSFKLANWVYWLLVIGTILILVGGSTARYTAFPPLRHSLLTMLGLVLCLVGVALHCFNIVKTLSGQKAGKRHPAVYYYIAGAVLGFLYLAIAGVAQLIPSLSGGFGQQVWLDPLISKYAIWFGLHSYVNQMINVVVLGTLYVAIPLLVGKEIYSAKGAVWALGLYLIINVLAFPHHMLMDPIPLWQKVFAQYFTWMLAITTVLSVYNLLKTSFGGKPWGIAMKFIVAGILGYVIEGAIGIFHSTLVINVMAHNTQAIIGYVHAVFLLYITNCGIGALYALVPMIRGVSLYSEKLGSIHFWTTQTGMLGMVAVLLIAGYLGMPRNIINFDPAFAPWMNLAAAFAVAIFAAQLVFAYNLLMTLVARPMPTVKAEATSTGHA